ncbi:MAG: hypothetical protein V1804_04585 [Patescibacteria group bacterium]
MVANITFPSENNPLYYYKIIHMKVSLNIKIINGPYGGGMQFAKYLNDFLAKKGVFMIDNLQDEDIDIIILINPFTFKSEISAYSFWNAFIYKLKHPQTIIIERINECDERKKTNYMNKLFVQVNKYSDYVVYIASWLKPLMERAGMEKNKPASIILNGADERIFNMSGKEKWNGVEKLKIVTHHWGGNQIKGHDIYKRLDDLLEKEGFKDKFEFTFIGNYPHDIEYKNTRLLTPLSGKELAQEIKKHHIYITASRNEPAGMHHIEGAMCGLPLLYINSGALPEYCAGYGIEFNEKNFEEKLIEMRNNYEKWFQIIKNYDKTAQKMSEEYFKLISELYSKKEKYSLKENDLFVFFKYIFIKIYSIFHYIYWRTCLFSEKHF